MIEIHAGEYPGYGEDRQIRNEWIVPRWLGGVHVGFDENHVEDAQREGKKREEYAGSDQDRDQFNDSPEAHRNLLLVSEFGLSSVHRFCRVPFLQAIRQGRHRREGVPIRRVPKDSSACDRI